jgi:predicted nucleic acid-binding protein
MPVIDTSVIMAVMLGEPESRAAVAALSSGPVEIPDLLPLEVANALVTAVRRHRILAAEAGPRLAMVNEMAATWHPSRPLIPRALAISLSYQRRPYDALFVALAEVLDTHLLTLDRKLVQGLAGTPLAGRVRELGA